MSEWLYIRENRCVTETFGSGPTKHASDDLALEDEGGIYVAITTDGRYHLYVRIERDTE